MAKHRYKRSYKTIRKRSVFDVLKIFKYKASWIILLILVIIGSLTYLFVFSSVFQIKNIRISVVEKTPVEEITKIISDNTENIFTSDLKNISQNILEKYPQIASINIKRKFPDEIIVQIQERQPVATFCTSNPIFALRINCLYIDKEGIVFEETDMATELPVIKIKNPIRGLRLGQEIMNKDYLEKILSISSGLKDVQILEIYPYSRSRLNAKTLEGWDIYFNARESINPQIEELKIVLKEKLPLEERGGLEYIDLRFEKVYIKRSN